MEVKQILSIPLLGQLNRVRLDDRVECAVLRMALVDKRDVLLRTDRPLWEYLGRIADGPFPRHILASSRQLGRIVVSLDEMVTATQQLDNVDAEIDLLTMTEILRPYGSR